MWPLIQLARSGALIVLITLMIGLGESHLRAESSEKELIDGVLENATRIGDAQLQFTLRMPIWSSQPIYQTLELRYVMWVKGHSIRSDIDWRFPNKTELRQQLVNDQIVITLAGPNKPGIGNTRKKPITHATGLFHPRLLGLVCAPTASLHQYKLAESLTAFRAGRSTVTRVHVDGHDLWQLESQVGSDSTSRLWIMGGPQYAIKQMEFRVGAGKEQLVQSLLLENEYHPALHSWFPRRRLYRETRNGIRVREEIVEMTRVALGKDTPDRIFTIAGLGLAPGQEMQIDGEYFTWNGEKLVKGKIRGAPVGSTGSTWSLSLPAFLIFSGAFVTCIAAVVLLKRKLAWGERA